MTEQRTEQDRLTGRPPILGTGHAVRRIAHLSDLHLLEAGPVASFLQGLAIRFVSVGRALDARGRVRKLERALAAVVRARADHLVVTGDLTEVGAPAQFEVLAEVLHGSGIAPENVTLVPGNHDAYTSGEAWRRALEGPLRAYRGASAGRDGQVVERGDVVFLPVDVSCPQSIARSAGELRPDVAAALEARFADAAFRHKALVVAQHHHPYAHEQSAWQWVDGLRGSARLMDLLARHPHVQVLHGHLHRAVDRLVGLGKSRILGAPAIVEDDPGTPRVRLYALRDGQLEATGLCAA
jgi:3',5'-cyclic AMP phosphodiesterase CpdA